MLTVVYDPLNGDAVLDGNAEAYAKRIIEAGAEQVTIGNELVIHAFRVMVVRQLISPADIVFKFGDIIITVDVNAGLSEWPAGFCWYNRDFVVEILSTRRKRTLN